MSSTKQQYLSLKEASGWATKHLEKEVTISNISYLIQNGRIKKYGDNGKVLINRGELESYYRDNYSSNESKWKKYFGNDLNWKLSFTEYSEAERTKHVHRLHPYKGKFIPQLVEYFLDTHIDEFKRESFFNRGDIILDPFCGSGTTLIQANELGMHAIGIDISEFNTLMSTIKVQNHPIKEISKAIEEVTSSLIEFQSDKRNQQFEDHLLMMLKEFNELNFPSPEYKRKVRFKEIDEKAYAYTKEQEFFLIYIGLVQKYSIILKQSSSSSFMDSWFVKSVRDEIDFVFNCIKNIKNTDVRYALTIILSRTVRSCRATTHADLGSLKEPVMTTYYCKKHGKICKPLFSILSWWKRYSRDTIHRLSQFDTLRTDTFQLCLTGDSRTIDLASELNVKNDNFGGLVRERSINGIFTSPPYVGLIDYHEQHAYAYDLFGFERRDDFEIGPLRNGQGQAARKAYAKSISAVLLNCKRFLRPDYNVFIVANDKYNLYPDIAATAGMKIVNRFNRPVLNRVEKDRSAYSEIIFHLREE